jgi:Tfp pilus assembly protein PilF
MRNSILAIVCTALAACASGPETVDAGRYFNDKGFAAPTQGISASEVFALSPAMERYIETNIAGRLHSLNSQQALVEALYSKGDLRLEYDSTLTRNAAQAFESRSGNCLSLVIMTAAFAKQLGLAVRYQSLYTDETIGRSGNLHLAVDHINLSLGKRLSDFGSSVRFPEVITVDFIPPQEASRTKIRMLREQTVVAMFMNNRAVEALSRGNVDDAYWWAREAVVQDPQLVRAYNTLGVVYRRHGDLDSARRVLADALSKDPDNPQVLGNLTQVLHAQGKTAEANALKARLAAIEPDPPFKYFEQGQAALRSGDYRLAVQLFSKEVARAPDYHEFHYWLAVAYSKLGDVAKAQEHLRLAGTTSTTREDQRLYAAKLDRYRGLTVQ